MLFNAGVWTSEIGEVFAASTPARNQGLAQPLHDSAMDLALEADRVHHRPDVNLPRGTGSSNPVPSSGESIANLISSEISEKGRRRRIPGVVFSVPATMGPEFTAQVTLVPE